MADGATVAIPKDVIEPIVQARIQAGIVEALSRSQDLIEAAVTAALTQKVDRSGKVSGYNSENKYTLLESLANQYIQEAARKALNEHLVSAADAIRVRVRKELEKKSSVLAAALVDGLAKSVDTTYGLSLTISLKDRER